MNSHRPPQPNPAARERKTDPHRWTDESPSSTPPQHLRSQRSTRTMTRCALVPNFRSGPQGRSGVSRIGKANRRNWEATTTVGRGVFVKSGNRNGRSLLVSHITKQRHRERQRARRRRSSSTHSRASERERTDFIIIATVQFNAGSKKGGGEWRAQVLSPESCVPPSFAWAGWSRVGRARAMIGDGIRDRGARRPSRASKLEKCPTFSFHIPPPPRI